MRKLLLLAGSVLVFACKTNKPVAGAKTTQKPESEKTETDSVYRAAYDQPVDLLHTRLDLRPDWKKKWMYGTAIIDLKPRFYPVDTVVLNARGMELLHVGGIENGTAFDSLPYSYDGKLLRIRLKKKAEKKDTLQLSIRYIAKPDELEEGGSAAISDDKGLYFINANGENPDKPRELWTQGETESNSVWFPTIESTSQKMTQDIYLTVEPSMKTLSNGLFVGSQQIGDSLRTDHWKQTLPAAPYLTMIAAGPFKIVKDHWRAKAVDYYVDEPYEKYAKEIFGETPAMMEFYSKILKTDFPWEKFAQVVVHDYVSGAMENTTAVVHGTNMQQDPREMIDGDFNDFISHELFHQWFGDYVTCESWSNLTLNEGFANYGEYLWREHKYGKYLADEYLFQQSSRYLNSEKGIEPPLIRFYYDDREALFDRISYNKGGSVLHMLRNQVGDEAFFESLHDYLKNHAFGTAEVHDLRIAFEKTTGRDLNPFFNQWFLKSGRPSLKLNYAWNDSTHKQSITIEQTQSLKNYPVFQLPLEVDLYFNDTILHRKLYLERKIQSFSFDCPSKPLLVNVDAPKTLLCTKKDNHSKEEWRYQYRHTPLFLDHYEAIAALSKEYASGSQDAVVLQEALSDPSYRIRKMVVENCGGLVRRDSSEMLTKLQEMALHDASTSLKTAAIKALKKHYDYEKYAATITTLLSDSSYEVNAAAFDILIEKDSAAAAKHALELEKDSSSTILSTLAEYYSTDTSKDHRSFYQRALRQTKSWERIQVIKGYASYLRAQDDAALRQGVEFLLQYYEYATGRFSRSAYIAEFRKFKKELDKRTKDDSSYTASDSLRALNGKISTVLDEFDKKEKEKKS